MERTLWKVSYKDDNGVIKTPVEMGIDASETPILKLGDTEVTPDSIGGGGSSADGDFKVTIVCTVNSETDPAEGSDWVLQYEDGKTEADFMSAIENEKNIDVTIKGKVWFENTSGSASDNALIDVFAQKLPYIKFTQNKEWVIKQTAPLIFDRHDEDDYDKLCWWIGYSTKDGIIAVIYAIDTHTPR